MTLETQCISSVLDLIRIVEWGNYIQMLVYKYEAKRILASQITTRFKISFYTLNVMNDQSLLSSSASYVGFPGPLLKT